MLIQRSRAGPPAPAAENYAPVYIASCGVAAGAVLLSWVTGGLALDLQSAMLVAALLAAAVIHIYWLPRATIRVCLAVGAIVQVGVTGLSALPLLNHTSPPEARLLCLAIGAVTLSFFMVMVAGKLGLPIGESFQHDS